MTLETLLFAIVTAFFVVLIQEPVKFYLNKDKKRMVFAFVGVVLFLVIGFCITYDIHLWIIPFVQKSYDFVIMQDKTYIVENIFEIFLFVLAFIISYKVFLYLKHKYIINHLSDKEYCCVKMLIKKGGHGILNPDNRVTKLLRKKGIIKRVDSELYPFPDDDDFSREIHQGYRYELKEWVYD